VIGPAIAAGLALVCLAPGGEEVPPPERILGFDPRAGGRVVDPAQVEAYLDAVLLRSPNVRLEAAGLSVEGRPIRLAFVSSRENLARLEDVIRRGELPVALVTFGVHPHEVGSSLAAPVLLHRLLAGETPRARELLEGIVLCIVPAVNPDGADRIARWLRAASDSPGQGGGQDRGPPARAPFGQHRFAGHDLNRDWVAGTQPETRALLEVHAARRPWLTIDVHQMAATGPRFFVPPYASPAHPALPADLLAHANALGERVLRALTRDGRKGGASRWTYDAWSPARSHPFYQGGMRFLIEVASASFAEPRELAEGSVQVFRGNSAAEDHPAPWGGGRWGIPEITGIMIAAAEAALGGLLDEPLRSAFAARGALSSASGIEVDRGWDPAVAAGLLLALETGGARIEETERGWIAFDPVHGRGWCRALLTCAEYPVGEAASPYDTTSSDLAHLAGLAARSVSGASPARDHDARRRPGRHARIRRGTLAGTPAGGEPLEARRWIVSQRSLAIFPEIADLDERGISISRIPRSLEAGGLSFAPGDFIVTGAPRAWVERAVELGASAAALEPAGGQDAVAAEPFRYPSIRLLAGEPSADEGWLRWVLEEHGFRFRAVRDVEEAAPGCLAVPGPFAGGDAAGGRRVVIVPEGAGASPGEGAALRELVRAGARVIAIGKGSRALAASARLPLREKGERRADLPGTLLRSVAAGPAEREPLLHGYASAPGIFYTGGPVWDAEDARHNGVEPILLIDGERPRLCGLLRPADETIAKGGAALVRIREGEKGGEWVLFGFSPHFRAWTLGTYRLLFNAILAP
jgi:hypothetical protein